MNVNDPEFEEWYQKNVSKLGITRSYTFNKINKHKFKAIRCERDNKKFDSKLERRYYDQLVIRQKAGDIAFFLRQIPFDLPGSTRYFADFMVFYDNGNIEIIDCKGKMTSMSILKIKQVESLYPIQIKIVKDKDF